jgi:phage shock protein A
MFSRLKNLVVGFMSLFIRGLEVQNPEALLEVEREKLRKGIALYNENLARQAGFIERLRAQIAALSKQSRDLTASTSANLQAGNRALAGQMALDLRRVNEQLAENQRQEGEAEKMYQDFLRQRDVVVREARERIEALSRKISQVKMVEAQAELSKLATAMPTRIGDSGDTIGRVEEGLQERYEKAAGTVRVAKDSVMGQEMKMKEAERAALADQALAEFAANMGMAVPGAAAETPAAPVEKAMGPKEKTSG